MPDSLYETKKRLFLSLKEKGLFSRFSDYEEYGEKDLPKEEKKTAKSRRDFLDWKNSLEEKERTNFEYVFGKD